MRTRTWRPNSSTLPSHFLHMHDSASASSTHKTALISHVDNSIGAKSGSITWLARSWYALQDWRVRAPHHDMEEGSVHVG